MLNKINNGIVHVYEIVYGQINIFKSIAQNRIHNLIHSWLSIFPLLESNHLKVDSFGVNVGFNPSLEVEMYADPNLINEHTLPDILLKVNHSKPATTVFKSIQRAITWHHNMSVSAPYDKIYVKLLVKITPEVKVFLGTPKLT